MTNLDTMIIETYESDTTEQLRNALAGYEREAKDADNDTRREMANNDADLMRALIAHRLEG